MMKRRMTAAFAGLVAATSVHAQTLPAPTPAETQLAQTVYDACNPAVNGSIDYGIQHPGVQTPDPANADFKRMVVQPFNTCMDTVYAQTRIFYEDFQTRFTLETKDFAFTTPEGGHAFGQLETGLKMHCKAQFEQNTITVKQPFLAAGGHNVQVVSDCLTVIWEAARNPGHYANGNEQVQTALEGQHSRYNHMALANAANCMAFMMGLPDASCTTSNKMRGILKPFRRVTP